MVQASGIRKARRTEEEEEPEESPAPVDDRATGRGLPPGGAAAADDGPSEPAPPPRPPGTSPFAQFTAKPEELHGHADRSRSDSVRIVAILVALVLVVGVGSILAIGGTILGLHMTGTIDAAELAAGIGGGGDGANGKGDGKHIKDTGEQAPDIEIIKRGGGGGGGGGAAPEPEPEVRGPDPAPVSVTVPDTILFHELEVSCSGSSFRSRAKFRGSSARVNNVPPNEICIATFKGSQPATTKVRAGDNLNCTFNPTYCQKKY
jgi:hypothetical protein